MRGRGLRLYNVIFPIWLLWLVPPVCIASLVGNFLIDMLVVVLTLKHLRVELRKQLVEDVLWPVYGCGFLADLAGAALLLASQLIESDDGWWYENVQYPVAYDPFANIWSFLWVTVGVAVAAVCIYWLDRKLALKNAALTETGKHKLAMSLAGFTAPYLFYLPMKWFW
ncbi:hypothetical protein SDC9_141524 [bioreactor metagenome]|uniref:Uncharacterized protein n=1 Tax=bioreactor metagenome TaxID=1076179 RepID=A0A645DZ12_9ZZZZ|nr:hypothetical protein [Oscillibacter sp.]